MAFSVSTNRSRSQDSPMLWLSLLAGSLVLHLALLLIGRWYFSQTASAPSGTAQAPLDFVEIDPNAPALKQPSAPSRTATQAAPKAAPPASASTESNQSPSSIENLTPQVERSQPQTVPSPSPSPFNPSTPPNRTRNAVQPAQPEQPSTETTKPNRTSANTAPNRSTTTSGRNNPNQTSPTGRSNLGLASSGGASNSSPSTSESSGNSRTNTPNGSTSSEKQPNGSSTTGSTSETQLTGEAKFQGTIARTLERDPNERQQDGALAITVKNETIPPISIASLSKLSNQVLDLKVLVIVDRDGRVFKTEVRNDSPALQANPELKESKTREDLEATVFQMLSSRDDLFEVKPEANATPDQLFSRIAQIQVKVSR